MKKKEWINKNRMLFESGHKTFDRQTTLITTGNVIADTQLSRHIRARTETDCYGNIFPEGHLQNLDVGTFRGLPSYVRNVVMRLTEIKSVILYQFHHHIGEGRRIIHGYVVTTPGHHLLRWIVTGPTYKSELVILEATKYVAD